jgi:hypothetical protein
MEGLKTVDELERVIHGLRISLAFYEGRMNALQQYQKGLPEPYRTEVCNILANGTARACDAARYDLKELRMVASEACNEAFHKRAEINDAVNWANVSCVSAQYCVDDEGYPSYRVEIEEASPNCSGFREFIHGRLEAAGFHGIDIQMEW